MTEDVAISVKLFGILRDRMPADADRGRMEMRVPAGSAVADVLMQFGISPDSAGHLVVLVNGHQAGADHVLQEGDALSAFPALSGG